MAAGVGGGGGGVTVFDTTEDLTYSGNDNGDQAYVKSNNRLYIWDSIGWYNVALINNAPNITSVTDDSNNTTPFYLSTSGDDTVITIVAVDSDGDPLTYTVTKGAGFDSIATISQDSSVFTITPFSEDSVSSSSNSATLTFKVSDGVNISSSINTFTLTFALPGSVVFTDSFMDTLADTSTQPHSAAGDGASTQVYSTITGQAVFTDYPTVAAAGSIGDFPANMGNHRFFNESTGGHTKGFIVDENPFSVSSGNGSMEFFIRYNNNYSARQFVVCDKYAIQSSTSYGLTWLRDGLTDASIYVNGVGASNEQTSTLTVGTWYHCYFAKVGTGFYFYLDGSLESSWTVPANMSYVINRVVFMNSGDNNGENDGAAVSIAGIRFHKGDLIYATSGGSTITGVDEPV